MVIKADDIERIKQLRKAGKTGSQISKEIHKRKSETLRIIRIIESKKEPSKPERLIHTPIKFLSEKKKERKQKIIIKRQEKKERQLPLTQKELREIDENVRKNEADYKIIKKFKGTKEKKVKKQIKKSKNKIKKEKLKDINNKYKEKGYKCNFNYITQHHIGYEFQKPCSYVIFEGITEIEIQDIIKDIVKILKILNNKVRCDQRIHYTSLEYKIYMNDGSIEYSKTSSNINTEYGLATFKSVIEQVSDLIYYLVNLVHQAQSPKEIEIYNIVYVNYDTKSNVKGNIFV